MKYKFILLALLLTGIIIYLFKLDGFILHADLNFLVDYNDFITRHTFLWNELNGAVGIDTNIRLFSRGVFLLLYYIIRDNIVFSYIFIVLNILFIYFCGFIFLNQFLQLNKKHSSIISLLFIFNPIFLGNISKIGLVFAANLLPLIIICIKKYFETSKLYYLFFILFLINFSFIHPFTFFLNIFLTTTVFIFYTYRNKGKLKKTIKHIIITIPVGILINLYFILPIMLVGLYEKSALSNSTGDSGDDNFLFHISNTKSILEALSLSKSVFVEYIFYTENTKYLYYSIFIIFYITLLYLYLKLKEKISKKERVIFFISVFFFAVTTLLTRGSGIELVGRFYKFLITIPGGWAFRSPLKWQLYQPFLLLIIVGVLYKNINKTSLKLKYLAKLIFGIFILSNIIIVSDIYNNLILPDNYTSELSQISFNDSEVLYQNDKVCRDEFQDNIHKFDLLKHQIKNEARVFKVLDNEELYNNFIYFRNYDFIIVCNKQENEIKKYFDEIYTSNNPDFKILKNKSPNSELYTVNKTINVNNYVSQDDFIEYKSNDSVIAENLEVNFADVFIDEEYYPYVDSHKNIEIVYEYKEDKNLLDLNYRHNGELIIDNNVVFDDTEFDIIEVNIDNANVGINGNDYPLFDGVYSLGNFYPENLEIKFISNGKKEHLEPKIENLVLRKEPVNEKVVLNQYNESENLIDNNSFEDESWQEEVGNCFNYDPYPDISMEITDEFSTVDNKSLKLTARRHVACINQELKVNPNYDLEITMDTYTSEKEGVFEILLQLHNESENELTERIEIKDQEHINVTFSIPKDTISADLYIRVPQTDTIEKNIVYFDNIQVISRPSMLSMYHYNNIYEHNTELELDYMKLNPTKYTGILRTNGTTNIVLQQGYNSDWVMTSGNQKIGEKFVANYSNNGWFVDINEVCKKITCIKDSTGFITIDFTIEYYPQKIFVTSMIVSVITVIGINIYLVIDIIKSMHKEKSRNT